MKILLISSTFPPHKLDGIATVSCNLAKSLVKRGHDVTVYTTDINDRYSRIPDTKGVKHLNGINVHYFRNLSNWLAFNRYYLPLGLIPAIRRELKNFDVIHIHGYRDLPTLVAHYYAKKYGIPYVLQAHGSLTTFFQKGWLKKIFDRLWGYRILKDVSKVIALTSIEAEQYESMGVREDKIEIIPNGITLTEFENLPQRGEFRKKWGINDSLKVVLYLGRIHQTKGIDLLVKAFAGLTKELGETKLVIVGPDDGHLPALKKLTKELDIEGKVVFTGPLYERDKLQAYDGGDVFVTPSFYGFPVTLVEACACGVPIVTTAKGDRLDWIHGQVGLVVPYDKKQLADAIAKLLSNEGLRIRFGEEGRRLVKEKFNWEKIAEQVEGIYHHCLHTSGNCPEGDH
jgi:glycosyltransferase involved in cell wall biosynthesis